MKIAIPSDDGITLCQHFGRTAGFAIIGIEEGRITSREYRPNTFTGHAAGHHHHDHDHGPEHQAHVQHSHSRITEALADCEVVIAGGMGRPLAVDLAAAGKTIYNTTLTDIEEVTARFLSGTLVSDKGDCNHHG